MSNRAKPENDSFCFVKESKHKDIDAKEAIHIFLVVKNKFLRLLMIQEDIVRIKKRKLDQKSKEKLEDLYTEYKRHLISLKRTTVEQAKLTQFSDEFKQLKARYHKLTNDNILDKKEKNAQNSKPTTSPKFTRA